MLIIAIKLLLLLTAAWTDVRSRLISNRVCVALAAVGAVGRLLLGPWELAISLSMAVALLLVLLPMHGRWIGGGDVKLLVAIVIGLPALCVPGLFVVMALAGGVLAGIYLLLRTNERWRALRHAPLPYGVAIACGGFWAILN